MHFPHLEICILRIDVSLEVIVRPADVDVCADVIFLHRHGSLEVSERLAEAALALKGVADVVEELRVALVHLHIQHVNILTISGNVQTLHPETNVADYKRFYFHFNKNNNFHTATVEFEPQQGHQFIVMPQLEKLTVLCNFKTSSELNQNDLLFDS